jgi:hypothetical protein
MQLIPLRYILVHKIFRFSQRIPQKCNCPALASQDLQRESKNSFSPIERKKLINETHLLMPCKGIIAVFFKTDNKVTRGENAQFLIPGKVVDIVTTLTGKLK